ncbi:CHAT domain-containing protein [Campylobacter concisus]|uniref:CHAT domain-containing protein n=1 Tax=Campylobacter concisus TaxID=199 RepID=UPI000D30B566|nr:CHAT domain-containing tetratricopeptide repeat protein [Campylobacter concisus]
MLRKILLAVFLTVSVAFSATLDDAKSYSATAYKYYQDGNYPKSLEFLTKALEIREKALGKDHPDTATSYNNIGIVYKNMGDYPKALEFYTKALDIYEKVLGKDHPSTALSYNNIGSVYSDIGDYPKALEFYTKALNIREKVLGKEHPDTAITYGGIGYVYSGMGDYPKALEFYTKALNIREKVLGKEHPDTATSYSNIGSVYSDMGDYPKALEFYTKCLSIREKVLGKDHSSTANSYNNIGLVYNRMGDYPKALEFHAKALNIKEKVLGKDHSSTANSYNNIGLVYSDMGDYPKALEFYTKALNIYEKVLGKDHTNTATSYNNIGYVYNHIGNYPKALEFYTKALNIREKVLGKNHTDTANSYNNIGSVYNKIGDHPKALEFHTKALDIFEKVLGKDHPYTATSYNSIGLVYSDMGDYPKALEFYAKALSIREKVLGKDHPDTALSYNNIGYLYSDIGNYPKAYNYSKEAYNIFKANRDKNFEILSNEQKKKFLEANRWYLPHLLTSGYSYQQTTKDKKALSQEIYEIFINDKGILLDDENTIAMLKNISQDKNLISKIDNLDSLKRAYAKLAGTMPKSEEAKSYQEKLKALGEDIEKAEIEIAKISPKFKQELGIKDLKLSDLTNLLKPNELFVDIGYYGKNYYIFSVDKSGEVKFEKLNNKDSDTVNTTIKEFRADIDKIINATDANSSKALKELYSIVITNGIGDRIDKFNSLIISTDGALRLLPFETLMDGDRYLIESKQIRYTPSAKEFIRTHKFNIKDEGKDITMFSDPNYESKSGKIMEMVADTPNVNKAVQTRSIKNMGTFKRLRGFKKEEEVLQSSFSGVKLFSRENANEENILAVKSPKILHITTHGYFISDENITNPMLKSGVALSGANIGIKQQTGEGLVNALKLSGLSLDGTDLVVLSACETGLVDVKDTSSVASLPKTFIQAGSKNVLMSLWSVDDNSTVELMKEFYTDTQGNEKKFNEVLRNAKIKMIKEGKHPFYWAAFIMSGE